jgi:hypothetical protein
MALIKCSECGKEISSNVTSCPECGNPINKETIVVPKRISKKPIIYFPYIFLIIFGIVFFVITPIFLIKLLKEAGLDSSLNWLDS